MSERIRPDNTPKDVALSTLPKPLEKALRLSRQQEAVALGMVTPYMRKHHIDYTVKNRTASAGVLVIDALLRGISLAGRQVVSNKDDVRKLINIGLKQRDAIYDQAGEILRETFTGRQTSAEKFIGPFALSKRDVINAANEHDAFYTSPVPNCEKIVSQMLTRSAILPELVKFAITALPKEQFPKTTIETFPDKETRSKLVRNMITSLVFRSTPFPYISIESLIAFTKRSDFQTFFSPEIAAEMGKAIASKLNLPEDPVASYVSDLYSQIEESFNGYTLGSLKMTGDQSEANRDRAYRSFKRAFLLLHPALEETQLITNPAKIHTGNIELSLWSHELSEVMGSFRVPKLDAVYKALRLDEAQGYRNGRFTSAVKAWRILRRSQESETTESKKFLTQINLLDQEIMRIEDSESQLPKLAEFIMRTYHNDEWIRYVNVNSFIKNNNRIIANSSEKRVKTLAYVNNLRERNNGELPEEADGPEWVIEQERKVEARIPGAITKRAEVKIEIAVDNLLENFLTAYDPTFQENILGIDTLSINEISVLSNCAQQVIDKAEKDWLSIVPINKEHVDAAQVLEYINLILEDYDPAVKSAYGRKNKYSEDITQLFQIKKRIEENIAKDLYANASGIPREYYIFCMKQRKKNLDEVIRSRYAAENIPQTKEIASVWTKRDIEFWNKEIEASTLPADVPINLLIDSISSLKAWRKMFVYGMNGALVWPKEIPSRDRFVNWMEDAISSKKRMLSIVGTPNYVWQRGDLPQGTLRSHINMLSSSIEIVQGPIFPSCEGMRTSEFWPLFARRIQIAEAIVSNKIVHDDAEEIKREFFINQRKYYKEHLEQKKIGLGRKLLNIQAASPSLAVFLRKMQELNLVAEEPQHS